MTRGAVVVIAAVIGLAGCSAGSAHPRKPSASPSVDKIAQINARVNAQTQRQAAARRLLLAQQRAERLANKPRKVYMMLKGTASAATITYTATGGGTSQRTINVPTGWGNVTAKLRPGDFVDISAQNEGETGAITCKIAEETSVGPRQISPPTTSSGPYAITDCNGTVR